MNEVIDHFRSSTPGWPRGMPAGSLTAGRNQLRDLSFQIPLTIESENVPQRWPNPPRS